MKPLVLAIALALGAAPLLSTAPAHAAPAAASKKPVAAPAWVARSNQLAQILLDAQGPFQPESTGFFGVPGYDDKVADLGPDNARRYREAMTKARGELQAKLASEKDPNVRQDLEIMIGAATESIEGSTLGEQYFLPWSDAPQTVFSGLNLLLSDQVPAERRAKAVDRLKAYAGLQPGGTPLTTLARQRYEERLSNSALLQPTKIEVQQSLDNVETYISGIESLLQKYKVTGADEAMKTLAGQLKDYAAWTRSTVLPKAREDTRLPAPVYAYQLKQVGIDIDPKLLMQRAQLEFMETRSAMRQLAPLVVQAKGLKVSDPTDPVAVIRALKKETIANDQLEGHYRKVIDAIDPLIHEHQIVDVPQRAMQMRLGSAAESAASPAPHFLPAPLVNNTGQQGTFVLPLGNPAAGEGAQYDDFNFGSAAWTLSAHEGRPGHELQFTAMVERGVSLARTMFAFNSVNVEGWALYAEAEMVPYEPLDGQLIALQFRLLRAARAMLDPMLNLGLIERADAERVLIDEVSLSKAMATQELDRYTVRMPGQAGSYFYGYTRILELRMQTELALGAKFDRKAFNNFLLDQGLLPPDQLAKAVNEVFIPKYR
ncbi:hypothetical protein ABB28_10430 [Stenotrophomonas chelatiphaga]|jgi:uncharacterized protein DUF885|uniref:DUF885 domain-containing protein n=1 Tax=Stenotrophomonas chelatiphaga TaxID=517011 RepID=A0A0R0CUM0_9GAMM|nr:DUF885 domain-containing protein [Stenotrophomonas chelatiphaga]KRG73577.1 hypothetical protein ABB28_10430 [Stenotrophomonas chelatiphaga]MCS4230357.1 hypothetical protein [Stenotrophomonas chelatiphaga]ROQ40290.1 uncharacterized protein (DUF885 family) [Stenotrophomonas maltophilia]